MAALSASLLSPLRFPSGSGTPSPQSACCRVGDCLATLKVKSMARNTLLLSRVAQAGGENVSLGVGKSTGDGRNEL